MSAGRARTIAGGFARRFAGVAATGAIFSAFSELWFYRIEANAGQLGLILAYGFFGYILLLTLRLFQVQSFAGFFVAAAMFGFLIEGVLVPVLYLNLPFSVAWTSLGWHALFTVCVGYYLFRKLMSARAWRGAALLNGAIGVGLGVWNAYLWNVVETDAVISGYHWHDTREFSAQFLVGYGLFVGGHLLLDRFPVSPAAPSRQEYALWFTLAMAVFGFGYFLPLFPYSLVLPFALLISFASLRAGLASQQNDWLAQFLALRIPLPRYALSLLIPGLAIASYWAVTSARLEWETNVVVAGLAVPISSIYWIYALLRANHAGHSTRPGPPPRPGQDER